MRQHNYLLILGLAVLAINIILIIIFSGRTGDTAQAVPTAEQPDDLLPKEQVVGYYFITDERCTRCFDLQKVIDGLEYGGVRTTMLGTLSPETFDLSVMPAIAFNSTITTYPGGVGDWEKHGKIVNMTGELQGTWYVLYPPQGPYYSLKEERMRGLVTITYLNDSGCEECYDVKAAHHAYLDKFSMAFAEERVVDVNSAAGKLLVQQYTITAVPTIIMDEEAAAYPSIQLGWNTIGTVENDGSYVFRDPQRLNVVYYDLEKKEVMRP